MHSQQAFNLPTVSLPTNTGIDILLGNISDNYDKMRDRIFSLKTQIFRALSLFLTKSSIIYHERIELNNTMNVNINIENNFPRLSYETSQKKTIRVSMATDPNRNTLNKCVIIECPTLSPPYALVVYPTMASPYIDDIIINIQLLYDLNALIEPDL